MTQAATDTSRLVYLDHNATTPLAPSVMEVMMRHLGTFGNPSSIHLVGQEARRLVIESREQTAGLLNALPSEICFTSSGSESDNLAIKGCVLASHNGNCHVITSAIEHSAVLETCDYLETLGHEVTRLPVDGESRLDPEDVRRHLRPNTRLISIMHANNETGVIQPVEEIAAIAQEAGVYLHCDMVQTAGKFPIDLSRLPVHLAAVSAHKFYGPKGIGVLVVKEGVHLHPLIHGPQESSLRGGTENVLGIVGLGAACLLAARTPSEEFERQGRLRDRLVEGLTALDDVRVNGNLRYALPGTVNIAFRYIKGQALATALAFQNIAVSTGSACHAVEVKPSHVLKAIGVPDDYIFGAIRFSLGKDTTLEEIDHVIEVMTRLVGRLRMASPLGRKPFPGPTSQAGEQHARIQPSANPLAGAPYSFVVSRETPEDSQSSVDRMAAEGAVEGGEIIAEQGRTFYGLEDGLRTLILKAPDEAAAWREALAALRDIVPSESGAAIRREPDGRLFFLDAFGTHADEIRGMHLEPGTGCAGFSIHNRIALLVRDPGADERFCPAVDRKLGHQTRTLLTAPVMLDATVFGCLEVLNPPPERRFVNADLARAESVAQVLAQRLGGPDPQGEDDP